MNTYATKSVSIPYIIFLTGASGAGKTTLLSALRSLIIDDTIELLHFDSIGVPSEAEMIRQYGSGSEWQKAMTVKWIERILEKYSHKKLVILEGQINCDYILYALYQFQLTRYQIILVHCDDTVRHYRLRNRQHSELINFDMDNWAKFLKQQAHTYRLLVLDTTHKKSSKVANILIRICSTARAL